MMLLFKPDEQGNATQIKQHYSSVQENLSFRTIQSYIEQAQDKFLKPILGKEQLKELILAFQNDTLSSPQEKLLHLVQRTLVYYTFADNFTFLDVFVSDAGTQQANLKETTPIPQWKFINIIRQLFESADNFAEMLLEFLEENKNDYPLWENSKAYTFATELLVNSANDFNNCVPINSSRRTFLKLRPFILTAENYELSGLISQEFLQEVKNVNFQNKEIKDLCKNIVCYLGFVKALPTLNITSTAEGFLLTSYSDTIKNEALMSTETKNTLIAQYNIYAQRDMLELKKILDKNPELYPTYKNSEAYIAPSEKTFGKKIDNSNRRNFVI